MGKKLQDISHKNDNNERVTKTKLQKHIAYNLAASLYSTELKRKHSIYMTMIINQTLKGQQTNTKIISYNYVLSYNLTTFSTILKKEIDTPARTMMTWARIH